MTRKKNAEETAQTSHVSGNETDAGQDHQKRPWKSRIGHWRDNDAGVRIEEDRRNNLSTIIFKEEPPAKAVKLLQERGWVEDKEGGGWSRKMIRSVRERAGPRQMTPFWKWITSSAKERAFRRGRAFISAATDRQSKAGSDTIWPN